MRYKITQLYDCPESPIGTVMHAEDEYDNHGQKYALQYYYEDDCIDSILHGANLNYFDNPKFFKKEIDYDKLNNLACPKCGGTKGVLFSEHYYNPDRRCDEDYGFQYSIAFECVCGHKRVLFGTKRGNSYLKEKYNITD